MKLTDITKLFKDGKAASTKSHMKNLIEMALADGHFELSERELLNELAMKYKVSEKALSQIEEDRDSIALEIPEDTKEKFKQFYELVHMMIINKEIHPDEKKMCRIIAGRFGYPKDKFEELIESIANNIRQKNNFGDTYARVGWMLT
ncbi:MAG TPA: hypothetical protein ACFCUD_12900 [Cyclobacteriaceae bacterium]